MKSSLSLFILLACSYFSHSTESENPSIGCLHQGELIEPFDSVWVPDPILIKERVDAYSKQGLSQTQIESRLHNADWTGFRLVCQPVIEYAPNPSATVPAASFTVKNYVMTFNRYSMEYYRNIQAHLSEQDQSSSASNQK